jgi:transcriptional regulator with XRE-family HTH domain
MSLHDFPEAAMLPSMGSLNAAALRAIRERTQPYVSQETLAKAVGIGSAHLSRIENGIIKPRPRLISALAEHLGVPVSAITNPHVECPDCARRRTKAA